MTNKEIDKIIETLKNNLEIANRPNAMNNIIIKDNTVSMIKDGVEVERRILHIDSIKNKADNMIYGRNIFENIDAKYSPLEADRNNNHYIWKREYRGIDFPKMMSVMLFSLLVAGELPTIFELFKIYSLTYTEVLNPIHSDITRFELYNVPKENDRKRLGAVMYFENKKITNKLLRFKEDSLVFVKGLPINEFTTEQLFCRIYKCYGSLVRDIYAALYFNKLGAETYYDYAYDINGIDCMVNGIFVFAYTNTRSAKEFRKRKMNERHPELGEVGIALETDFRKGKTNKIHLINETAAQKVIQSADALRNKKLMGIVKISF